MIITYIYISNEKYSTYAVLKLVLLNIEIYKFSKKKTDIFKNKFVKIIIIYEDF